MRMVGGLAISLSLLKPPPPLKTKQRRQQICICGKSQTAGLDRPGMDGCMDEDGRRCGRCVVVVQLRPADYLLLLFPAETLAGCRWGAWTPPVLPTSSVSPPARAPALRAMSAQPSPALEALLRTQTPVTGPWSKTTAMVWTRQAPTATRPRWPAASEWTSRFVSPNHKIK